MIKFFKKKLTNGPKTKKYKKNNKEQNWNINKWEDNYESLNGQREFWGENREKRRKEKRKSHWRQIIV
jgi:hypothetical protein